jgi:hypothetical protein
VQRHPKIDPAFQDVSELRHVAMHDLRLAGGQALQLAAEAVVAREDAGRLEQLDQRRDDGVPPRLHTGGAHLHNQMLAVAIHHQPRQAVALGMHQPVMRRRVQVLTQRERVG